MKLSEAIREGGKHFKQGRRRLIQYVGVHEEPLVCALGAAHYAMFGEYPPSLAHSEKLRNAFPELLKVRPGANSYLDLEDTITEANDCDGRSFDEIADMVEGYGY